tara:strand:- start:1197 stop:1538 length:342 start_codon:yes stop_codon:yes gene_type:complete
MKFFAFVITLIAIIGITASIAQEIKIDNLEAAGLKVTAITVEVIKKCDATYSPNDLNKNGILDRVCIGLEYDVCNPDGVAVAYNKYQQAGKTCKTYQCVPENTVVAGPVPLCN